jgi:hypothetical protein
MIIENKYQDIPFAFQEIDAAVFQTELDLSLSELVRYLYTWSSVQKYIQKNLILLNKYIMMILLLMRQQQKHLEEKQWFWPIYMRVGRY